MTARGIPIPPDPVADRINHGHVVFSKSWKSDLWLYLKNNHVILSLVLAHPKHIYTPIERRIVLLISLTFAAGVACLFAAIEKENDRTVNLLMSIFIGGLFEGCYDMALGVSAKCGCVQDMNKYLKCCCEYLGKCAICVQMAFSAFWFFAFFLLLSSSLESRAEEGEDTTESDVALGFILSKVQAWILMATLLACFQFWRARRGQLKPTSVSGLEKWNRVRSDGKPKKKGKKLWDKYIGEQLCATNLPDYAPSYPTTCLCIRWTNAETAAPGLQTAVVRQPVSSSLPAPHATQTVMVSIPPGVMPGQNMQVQSPFGGVFMAQVPPGMGPGAQLQVLVPAPAQQPPTQQPQQPPQPPPQTV